MPAGALWANASAACRPGSIAARRARSGRRCPRPLPSAVGDHRRLSGHVRRDDHVVHSPQRMIRRQWFDLEDVERPRRRSRRPERRHQVCEVHDCAAADIDQVRPCVSSPETASGGTLFGLGRVRRGDDHKIALGQQVVQSLDGQQLRPRPRAMAVATGSTATIAHAEARSSAGDLPADVAQSHDAQRQVAQVRVGPIDGVGHARSGGKGLPRSCSPPTGAQSPPTWLRM